MKLMSILTVFLAAILHSTRLLAADGVVASLERAGMPAVCVCDCVR